MSDSRPGPEPHRRSLDVAYEMIRHGSKSFALASRLLPEAVRDEAVMLYAWCRRVDDAVDGAPPERIAQTLERLERELDAVFDGQEVDDPVVDGFRAIVARRQIPYVYPRELLLGQRMDASAARYETVQDLLSYGYRVASTVGLMMCHVMGVRRDAALVPAAHLGLAMQLTNVCRDVLEDWRLGRLYLPAEELARWGAPGLADSLGGPLPAGAIPAVRGVVLDLLDLADRYYRSGWQGLVYLSSGCATAMAAAASIYAGIGHRIRCDGADVTVGRAVVPRPVKAVQGARGAAALAGMGPRWWRRAHELGPVRMPGTVLERRQALAASTIGWSE